MKNILNKISSLEKILVFTNLFLVIVLIVFIMFFTTNNTEKSIILRDKDSSYLYTSPILDCEDANQNEELKISPKEVIENSDILKEKYNINTFSVYFRDLNNGPWVGVNEKSVFSPASLLKVPVLIGLFSYAEDEPYILDKKITVNKQAIDAALQENIKSSVLVLGGEYTLLEVAEHMIQQSDNVATYILSQEIPQKYINNVFDVAGIKYEDLINDTGIRVKDYAGFFRILYNSSYLNREMSEKALAILAGVEYKNGIVSGVPNSISVAHKFGERTEGMVIGGAILNDKVQLHDCGIIYHPEKPYILCVMTRSEDIKSQEKFISEISKYFYDAIDKKDE